MSASSRPKNPKPRRMRRPARDRTHVHRWRPLPRTDYVIPHQPCKHGRHLVYCESGTDAHTRTDSESAIREGSKLSGACQRCRSRCSSQEVTGIIEPSSPLVPQMRRVCFASPGRQKHKANSDTGPARPSRTLPDTKCSTSTLAGPRASLDFL